MDYPTVTLKINGQELNVDLSKAHETWIEHLLTYGARRFPNDSFSGEKGQTKYDLVRDLLAEIESGEPKPEKTRSRASAPADPIEALAFKTAKGDLLARFKMETGAGKIADIVAAGNAAVNKYFRETENGPVWNEEEVKNFIDRMAEAKKRDYRAEAKTMLSVDF